MAALSFIAYIFRLDEYDLEEWQRRASFAGPESMSGPSILAMLSIFQKQHLMTLHIFILLRCHCAGSDGTNLVLSGAGDRSEKLSSTITLMPAHVHFTLQNWAEN